MIRKDLAGPSILLALILLVPLTWTLTSCGEKGSQSEEALFKIAGLEGGKDCAVFRQKENRWVKVTGSETDLFLFEGDKVKTGAGTTVTLRLPNGGSSFLKENTEFQVTRLARSKEGASLVHVFMKIIRGTGLFSVKKAPPAFSVSTNHAVTGVLGTEFVVAADESKTQVDVLSGTVVVTPEGAESPAATLSKGQAMTVSSGGGAEGPRPVDIKRLSSLLDDFARLRGIQTKPGWNR